MREVVAEPHLLGRRGGDELVVLLANISHKNVAEDLAQRLIRKISEPMAILGMELSVTGSVGISYFPQDGVDLESLLNAADAAMFQAKANGGETFVPFSSALARRIDLRVRLEQRLRKALEARDFRLVYQPIVSFPDGKIIASEALLRWKDAELGEIAPTEFIEIAEESGLIVSLGDWVLREACRSRQVWTKLGLEIPPTAVNISARQLRNPGFVERVLEVLAEHEVQPADLEFEVTESTVLDMSPVSLENLMRLSNAGVKLALDDFGVGYSSLQHLRLLPIYRLKIDRSFIHTIVSDPASAGIVNALVGLGHGLGLTIAAETPKTVYGTATCWCLAARGIRLFSASRLLLLHASTRYPLVLR